MILDLLFVMAHWHALAKLRMHTDISLDLMEDVTATLGRTLHTFNEATSSAFKTRELRREAEARIRRNNRTASYSDTAPRNPDISPVKVVPPDPAPPVAASSSINPPANKPKASSVNTRRPKTLNLNTYKHHALGHYAATIRHYGMTDSYTTELVCTAQLIHLDYFLIISC